MSPIYRPVEEWYTFDYWTELCVELIEHGVYGTKPNAYYGYDPRNQIGGKRWPDEKSPSAACTS